MRLFYAADTTPNSAFISNIWRSNLLLPLLDLGHEVVEFDYDLSESFKHLNTQNSKNLVFIDKNRPKVSAELLRQIKLAHSQKSIDLFFSYFYDACVLPETIDEIKAMGIKTVNWYCNGAHQLHLVQEISPHYDWCLVPEKIRLNDYVQMGARPIYSQEAANPNIYKPYDLAKEYDVTFVGQAYGDRPYYVQQLYQQGIDIRVWGSGWKKYGNQNFSFKKKVKSFFKPNKYIALNNSIIGDILPDEELVKLFSRSKINLGFSTCGSTHKNEERIVQVRLRDFEAPMSGGFYMVEFMEELTEFYEIGKEIVCYDCIEDLIEKVKYYLKHDSEREAIRIAGYERCLRDHTWHKRFQNAFKIMGLER
jgi:spore maturation protein CgeB